MTATTAPYTQADWDAYQADVAAAVAAIRGLFTGDGGASWSRDALRTLPGTRAERSYQQQVTFAAANTVLRGE